MSGAACTLPTGRLVGNVKREISANEMVRKRTLRYSAYPDGMTSVDIYSLRAFFPSSISSTVIGQSALSKRDKLRSASSFPPVWHFAQ